MKIRLVCSSTYINNFYSFTLWKQHGLKSINYTGVSAYHHVLFRNAALLFKDKGGDWILFWIIVIYKERKLAYPDASPFQRCGCIALIAVDMADFLLESYVCSLTLNEKIHEAVRRSSIEYTALKCSLIWSLEGWWS